MGKREGVGCRGSDVVVVELAMICYTVVGLEAGGVFFWMSMTAWAHR